jgi:hypothetical protein
MRDDVYRRALLLTAVFFTESVTLAINAPRTIAPRRGL